MNIIPYQPQESNRSLLFTLTTSLGSLHEVASQTWRSSLRRVLGRDKEPAPGGETFEPTFEQDFDGEDLDLTEENLLEAEREAELEELLVQEDKEPRAPEGAGPEAEYEVELAPQGRQLHMGDSTRMQASATDPTFNPMSTISVERATVTPAQAARGDLKSSASDPISIALGEFKYAADRQFGLMTSREPAKAKVSALADAAPEKPALRKESAPPAPEVRMEKVALDDEQDRNKREEERKRRMGLLASYETRLKRLREQQEEMLREPMHDQPIFSM